MIPRRNPYVRNFPLTVRVKNSFGGRHLAQQFKPGRGIISPKRASFRSKTVAQLQVNSGEKVPAIMIGFATRF
jgi:hypothetical protein